MQAFHTQLKQKSHFRSWETQCNLVTNDNCLIDPWLSTVNKIPAFSKQLGVCQNTHSIFQHVLLLSTSIKAVLINKNAKVSQHQRIYPNFPNLSDLNWWHCKNRIQIFKTWLISFQNKSQNATSSIMFCTFVADTEYLKSEVYFTLFHFCFYNELFYFSWNHTFLNFCAPILS